MTRYLAQTEVRRPARQAFTLVELLVAMGIFVVLAALTVSAFRGTDGDRVTNAAATFKSALEGAKSRAVKMNQTVGLRLNLSPNNGRQVTSLIYVVGDETYETEARFEYDNRDDMSLPADRPKWLIVGTDQALWTDLKNKNRIGKGTRVRFQGRLFTLNEPIYNHVWSTSANFDDISTEESSGLFPEEGRPDSRRPNDPEASELDDMATPIGLQYAVASKSSACVIYLTAGILPGAEPIPLPVNACIDLEGSKVPKDWFPNNGDPGTNNDLNKYGLRITSNGTTVLGPMDIMFTPNGTVAAPLTTEGILHFRVASTLDLMASESLTSGSLRNSSGNPSAKQEYPVVVSNPQRGAKLVSIFTQTGNVMNADVYPHPSLQAEFNSHAAVVDGGPGSYRPYDFIIYGKESK